MPWSPTGLTDPTRAAVLAVSGDKLQGVQRDPFGEISKRSGIGQSAVIERIREMVRAGTIRRVRQTLLATNLAQGALVALRARGSAHPDDPADPARVGHAGPGGGPP